MLSTLALAARFGNQRLPAGLDSAKQPEIAAMAGFIWAGRKHPERYLSGFAVTLGAGKPKRSKSSSRLFAAAINRK